MPPLSWTSKIIPLSFLDIAPWSPPSYFFHDILCDHCPDQVEPPQSSPGLNIHFLLLYWKSNFPWRSQPTSYSSWIQALHSRISPIPGDSLIANHLNDTMWMAGSHTPTPTKHPPSSFTSMTQGSQQSNPWLNHLLPLVASALGLGLAPFPGLSPCSHLKWLHPGMPSWELNYFQSFNTPMSTGLQSPKLKALLDFSSIS